MSRTSIDLPDGLLAEVMAVYDLPTKRSAVVFALRRLLDSRMSAADLDCLVGVGWELALEELRPTPRGSA